MKKRFSRVGNIIFLSICMGVCFGCASDRKTALIMEEHEMTQSLIQEEQKTGAEAIVEKQEEKQDEREEERSAQESEDQEESTESFSPQEQLGKNKEKFYEEAEQQGIDEQTAESYLQILMDDNIFQDGSMALTGIQIDDIDGNGQADMLVMVLDAKEKPFYGSGGLWFYINDNEPYCFSEEDCSYYGWFDTFWEDIDGDENVEIVLSAQGTGCGAVGDSYKAVFKYKDHTIEQMRLPSDFEEDYDCGLLVEVFQEPEAGHYSAYCPYFDEKISFRAQNIEEWELPHMAENVGGNARGFFDMCVAEYQGKKALQASEYLFGEGGVVHYVATAQFLITWKEDGTPEVVEWWIEEDANTYANSRDSRISYSDGYFYYASQLDHGYLYRAREDGSKQQCLAKVQAANICVREDEIYFVSQSDGYGIYQIRTDGSGMKKLCETGHDVQISAGYVYFCDTYKAKYDVSGLMTEKLPGSKDNFLYRMNRDGSARELIATDVHQYVLSDGYRQEVHHIGSVYYTKYESVSDGDEVQLSFHRMGLDGQMDEELISIRGRVDEEQKVEDMSLAKTTLMVYDGMLYCVWTDTDWEGEEAIIFQYDLRSKVIDTISVPVYTSSCIYKGYFYGLCEQAEDGKRHQVKIFRVDLDGGDSEIIGEYTFQGKSPEGAVSDIYVTGEGVFFRRFVSEKEKLQWFRITEDGEVQKWEDGVLGSV